MGKKKIQIHPNQNLEGKLSNTGLFQNLDDTITGDKKDISRSLGEQTILRNLRQHDDRLANKIAGEPKCSAVPSLRWEDLAELDDSNLAAIAQEAETELIMLALAGADERFVERFLRQYPKPAADALAHRIDRLGPTRLSDVEAAQREVVALATRLIHGGEDSWRRSRLIIAA